MDQPVIRILCPNISCRRVLAVPQHARGKIVRCRECGTNVRIPASSGQPKQPPNEKPASA